MPEQFDDYAGYRVAPGSGTEDVFLVLQGLGEALLTLHPTTKVYFFFCLIVYAVSRIIRRKRRWSRVRALHALVEAEAQHDLDALRARRVRLTHVMGTNPRLGREGGYWGDGT